MFLGIFLGYVLFAGRNWRGDVLVADIEELGKLDASEIRARRLNAKEIITSKSSDNLIFPVARGTTKLSGWIPRIHSKAGTICKE